MGTALSAHRRNREPAQGAFLPDRWRGGLLRGLAVFALLRYRERPAAIFLYAFDLLEFDGQDLRREPLETRKATLASLLRGSLPGLRLVEHLEALRRCRLPLRLQARLRGHRVEAPRLAVVSGRTRHWLKFKNPAAPAVKREVEEDWR